jgi:hypothetical protein
MHNVQYSMQESRSVISLAKQSLFEDSIYLHFKEIGSEIVDWVKGSGQIPDAPSCEHNNDPSSSINDRVFY